MAFDDYATKYRTVRLTRKGGILLATLHTDDGPFRWSFLAHEELPDAFYNIGRDPENKVVILTGTGDEFSGPRPEPGVATWQTRPSAEAWDTIYRDGKALLMNLLNIEVPMIAAVNGPALRHSELALLCDIVLASEGASFQDSGHFISGVVPGDGLHIVYPLLLGINRARYFLLTGQTLSAQESKDLGLVAEILPRDGLLDRAFVLARDLARHPRLHLRYTRIAITEHLRREMQALLGYGLTLEGMALMERPLPERGL